jgi:hypothetical protein
VYHSLRDSFIVSLESLGALYLSESASSPSSPRSSSASPLTSGDDYSNTTSASTKTSKGPQGLTTLVDTIEMLNDLITDALAFFRGLFRFRAA